MTMKEIGAKAKSVGVSIKGMKKTEAIRAIQQAEGFEPCFGSGMSERCGQMHCMFREDCQGAS
jgi:hypothetical protein